MTDEEITVKLVEYDHEIRSLKHRMNSTEEQTKTINDLALSVKELALNMTGLIEEQKKTSSRIDKLEGRDGENWRKLISHILTLLVGAVFTYILTKIGL